MNAILKTRTFDGDDRKILFLDFDGVLNTYTPHKLPVPAWALAQGWKFSWVDPTKVAKLRPLLSDPDFRIVISSSWRSHWKVKDLQRILNDFAPGLGDRIIDVTPHRGMRGRDIDAWLKYNEFRGKFAILDDDISILPYQRHVFVRTDAMKGIDYSHIAKIKAILDYDRETVA